MTISSISQKVQDYLNQFTLQNKRNCRKFCQNKNLAIPSFRDRTFKANRSVNEKILQPATETTNVETTY